MEKRTLDTIIEMQERESLRSESYASMKGSSSCASNLDKLGERLSIVQEHQQGEKVAK